MLEYEAAGRQAALISTQLNNHQVISKVVEIEYRMGGSSTNSFLAAIEKQERLENQLIQAQIAQAESLRKILSLTGFSSSSNPTLELRDKRIIQNDRPMKYF